MAATQARIASGDVAWMKYVLAKVYGRNGKMDELHRSGKSQTKTEKHKIEAVPVLQ